jgi:hypothetical protein
LFIKKYKEMDREQKDPSTSETEIARLFRVYRTVHEMVKDRGYVINHDTHTDINLFRERNMKNGLIV